MEVVFSISGVLQLTGYLLVYCKKACKERRAQRAKARADLGLGVRVGEGDRQNRVDSEANDDDDDALVAIAANFVTQARDQRACDQDETVTGLSKAFAAHRTEVKGF